MVAGDGKKKRNFGRSGGRWVPKGEAPKGGRPKISRFFSSPATFFSLFLPLLEVVSWNYGVV